MKVSLICTVWNEEKNIGELLDSIKTQTFQPDEFVIVDGGSTDNTLNILELYKRKNSILKLIKVKKCNISEGRNIAIKNAKGDIIIGADGGGCLYHKDWIKNMIRGFNGQLGFGRTASYPYPKNRFQRISGKILTKNGNYGSSRNIIFTKKIWREVGGYPENFYSGEDTMFNELIYEKGYKATKIKDAIGYRSMRNTYKGLFNQFKNFGYGDATILKFYPEKAQKNAIMAIIFSYLAIPFAIIVFPLLFLSTYIRIIYTLRTGYFIGFHKGLLFGKLEKSITSGRKEKEIEKK
jgi:glycosyltransferase involved in cell wall biosynthesis